MIDCKSYRVLTIILLISEKLIIKVDLDVTVVVGKDDKKHWNLGKWTHTFELLDHVELDLETKALG